ncbi:5-formyltetrahydrofolate cyclo-ligase [Schizopora paradoxa]|uniref:5-formyltetrahydrofolate cyclo-ligase n=1 Tax=Schizopora paradoxa TaxID=27342 RepID=A0A0H2S561_9AGAM|nr:5-formyltetrahydrofolate cyclo-ligase [Schizopora paradoxa]
MAVVLQGAKQTLRKSMSLKLRSLSDAEIRQQSELVLKNVLSSSQYQRCKTVSCFLSMGGEVDTHEIAREIVSSGRTLYVPKIKKGSARTMDFLQIHDAEDLESLPSGVWGIKEPGLEYAGGKRKNAMDEDSEALDLILLPGVAFDRSLGRLGHGRGYYDQFINNYTKRCESKDVVRPALLALSLQEQILPAKEIPMGEFDRYMDGIITPDGIIEVEKESASSTIADAASMATFDTVAGSTVE